MTSLHTCVAINCSTNLMVCHANVVPMKVPELSPMLSASASYAVEEVDEHLANLLARFERGQWLLLADIVHPPSQCVRRVVKQHNRHPPPPSQSHMAAP